MEADEQREIVERLDAVLGMLSVERAAHQSAIEAALIMIRRVTSVSQ